MKGLALLGYKGRQSIFDARIEKFLELAPSYGMHYLCGTRAELEHAFQAISGCPAIQKAIPVHATRTYDSLLNLAQAVRNDDLEGVTIITSKFHVPRTKMIAGYAMGPEGIKFNFRTPEYPRTNAGRRIMEALWTGINYLIMEAMQPNDPVKRKRKKSRIIHPKAAGSSLDETI